MRTKIIIALLSFNIIIFITANDLKVGHVSTNSKKIFDEIRKAKFKVDSGLRTDYINVQAPAKEFISAVCITYLSEDKDSGKAFIESGGVGQRNVTIGLKCEHKKTGFKFRIEVYSNKVIARGTYPTSKDFKRIQQSRELATAV